MLNATDTSFQLRYANQGYLKTLGACLAPGWLVYLGARCQAGAASEKAVLGSPKRAFGDERGPLGSRFNPLS